MKIRTVPVSESSLNYQFMCPGCGDLHAFNDKWRFNQNMERPTISPSLLVEGYLGKKNGVAQYGTCHSFIKDGRIQFLNDCTHDLRGQTVEIPEFPNT